MTRIFVSRRFDEICRSISFHTSREATVLIWLLRTDPDCLGSHPVQVSRDMSKLTVDAAVFFRLGPVTDASNSVTLLVHIRRKVQCQDQTSCT